MKELVMIHGATELGPEFLLNVSHKNGQITYKKPDCHFIPKGTEIILRNLTVTAKINDVIRVTMPYGEILQARLLIDFSGNCRRYAYVAFSTKKMARDAIQALNNFFFMDQKLSALISVDNRRLHLSNIPKHHSEHELDRIIREYCSDVDYIVPYMYHDNPHLNRGFMFVEFTSHAAAALARRLLLANGISEWAGAKINVDWAQPVEDIPEDTANEIKDVFIRNIFGEYGQLKADEASLFLSRHLSMHLVVCIGEIVRDHMIIKFCSNEAASRAVTMLDGVQLNGHRVFAELARGPRVKVPRPVKSSAKVGSTMMYNSRRRKDSDASTNTQLESPAGISMTSDGDAAYSQQSALATLSEQSCRPSMLFLVFTYLKRYWSPFYALSSALEAVQIQLHFVVKRKEMQFQVSLYGEQVDADGVQHCVFHHVFLVLAERAPDALDYAAEKAAAEMLL